MYKRFGLLGHNGIDMDLPNGTQVIAPHGGKVIEATNDPMGYGNYIKIENDKEGSVLAHLQTFQVKVGDTVSEGQPIALSNNTGNSTGPHLHWGYYLFPRNRQNGYAGYIDQLPLLTSPGSSDALTQCLLQHTQLVTQAGQKDAQIVNLKRQLGVANNNIKILMDENKKLFDKIAKAKADLA